MAELILNVWADVKLRMDFIFQCSHLFYANAAAQYMLLTHAAGHLIDVLPWWWGFVVEVAYVVHKLDIVETQRGMKWEEKCSEI